MIADRQQRGKERESTKKERKSNETKEKVVR
jgi:hypothetical protein